MVSRIREEIAKGKFFERLIHEHFLDNPHRLKFVMEPDLEYNAKLKKTEEARLLKAVNGLTDAQKQAIHREGLELQTTQNAQQDMSCLPTVRINDVSERAPVYNVTSRLSEDRPSVRHFTNAEPTNGLVHFRAHLGFNVPDHLKIYLPLYAKALTWMGTHKYDRFKYSNEMEANTGGISFSPFVKFNPQGTFLFSFHNLRAS